jgi:CubicO group peptidase (beta-lactamase class C family)
MLRFAYLLLREGRWRDRELIPAQYVREASRRSRFNPHYPYSFQFTINDDGHVAGAPRDAFWKTGSGGHAFYVVPSLDLVIWKLGGRDQQYDDGNAPSYDGSREEWKRSVEENEASVRTLELVAAAVQSK